MTAVLPTFSISPVLIHFWHVVTLFLGGISWPVKNGLRGAIPELISKRLLSLCGTSDADGSLKWSLDSKNERNFSLISFTPNGFIFYILLKNIYKLFYLLKLNTKKPSIPALGTKARGTTLFTLKNQCHFIPCNEGLTSGDTLCSLRRLKDCFS